MKSHTSLVAQQTRLSEWADMVREVLNFFDFATGGEL